MKFVSRLLITAFILTSGAFTTNAQRSASADASATILVPLSLLIERRGDTTFKNIFIKNLAKVTGILSSLKNSNAAQAIPLNGLQKKVDVAEFVISDNSPFAYAITLPSKILLSNKNGDQLRASASLDYSKELIDERAIPKTMRLSADLNLTAVKTAGLYTSEPFSVTVNYN